MPERQRRRGTISACVLVELTLTTGVSLALDMLVNGAPRTGQIDIINKFGRKQVVVRLELLVVGRGSETEASRGPSELQ
eukprot:9476984-Pyramimonas_sp.AAC.1